MDPDTDVKFEFFPFIRQYRSGRIERFYSDDQIPAAVNDETGVTSKDIIVDPETGVSVRVFLPTFGDTRPKKLPIYVYFHGGGFVIGSAFGPTSHHYLTPLVAKANIIAVSVDYRLAPEHPLPIAYEDSWAALKWVLSQAAGGGAEAWLAEHGDFERIFVGGCSAGGNLAHHMALRAGAAELGLGARIRGMVLIHPYFGGSDPFPSELVDKGLKEKMDGMWVLACPGTVGMDDPLVNPLAEAAPSLKGLGCEKVLVCVAEKDVLRERGRAYYEGLKRSGWGGEVEWLESEGVGHAFHVQKFDCEQALELMERTVKFISGS
ncbi:tuliposide A-converting enzyme 2, chloroplastic-like [Phoenix dactylifera]|uniref:Tuliposide A-converting enzyme 2, chloroplastic-like n=1 Tax=Phoenix dactylifera TaxID=42345 RepID=A0A8B7MX84_PHODC|nr:tuliposide A-converting enzyme 2, chloroplastic-like [Phoenix dactylifera]